MVISLLFAQDDGLENYMYADQGKHESRVNPKSTVASN